MLSKIQSLIAMILSSTIVLTNNGYISILLSSNLIVVWGLNTLDLKLILRFFSLFNHFKSFAEINWGFYIFTIYCHLFFSHCLMTSSLLLIFLLISTIFVCFLQASLELLVFYLILKSWLLTSNLFVFFLTCRIWELIRHLYLFNVWSPVYLTFGPCS